MFQRFRQAVGWKPTVILFAVIASGFGWLHHHMPLPKQVFSCKVIGITDGDTFNCLSENQKKTIRLYGIDAPEKKQAYGQAARQYLSRQIFGKTVSVTSFGEDAYGRILGRVRMGDHEVNHKMVVAGYAWVYRQYSDDAGLIGAEETARAAKAGLWADPQPINPADFRHR
mgnify:CR=1 FL=1